MADPRAGKTFEIPWSEWIQFCHEQDIDPIENCELSFDLGGGDSYTVACYDPPEEVNHLQEIQAREDNFRSRQRRQ